jgi:hypothetical protein
MIDFSVGAPSAPVDVTITVMKNIDCTKGDRFIFYSSWVALALCQ